MQGIRRGVPPKDIPVQRGIAIRLYWLVLHRMVASYLDLAIGEHAGEVHLTVAPFLHAVVAVRHVRPFQLFKHASGIDAKRGFLEVDVDRFVRRLCCFGEGFDNAHDRFGHNSSAPMLAHLRVSAAPVASPAVIGVKQFVDANPHGQQASACFTDAHIRHDPKIRGPCPDVV